jgi:hypothetical protein
VDEEAGEEILTLALPGKGVTKLTINTANIEDEAEALRGIYRHALALEGSFAPHVQSCFDVIFPLIQFRFPADVRVTSTQSLAAVYESACCYGEQTGDFSMCSKYLSKFVIGITQQIQNENEMEALYALADSLSEILFSSEQSSVRASVE